MSEITEKSMQASNRQGETLEYRRTGIVPVTGRPKLKRHLSPNSRLRYFPMVGKSAHTTSDPNHIPPTYVTVDIGSINFPTLLGLEVLYMHSLVPNTVLNCRNKRNN